jgi:hypothetical protein
MPVVLVMVHSTPRQSSSIDWAVAEYSAGAVHLRGKEPIWSENSAGKGVIIDVDSFDSGVAGRPS